MFFLKCPKTSNFKMQNPEIYSYIRLPTDAFSLVLRKEFF
jgi:hypothetical protein